MNKQKLPSENCKGAFAYSINCQTFTNHGPSRADWFVALEAVGQGLEVVDNRICLSSGARCAIMSVGQLWTRF